MAKTPRMHSGDEFGKPMSGSLSGMDAPMIGAASMIAVDALADSEPGARPVTERPPAITWKMVAVGLGVMFLIGFVIIAVVVHQESSVGPGDLSLAYSAAGTGTVTGTFRLKQVTASSHWGPSTGALSIEVTQSVTPQGDVNYIAANLLFNQSTVFVIGGRPLHGPMPHARGLALDSMDGWPAKVDYSRAAGSGLPRATRVEF